MSGQCSDDIERIANRLGFSCEHAAPVVHIRNPFDLANWTLPVLELTVVAGAVLALWWAIRRLRRDGDPVNLVIWFSTVIYLLIVEPPLYFPTVFGVDDTIGAVFAHNVFTVEFMYDRLPLYIVALYPAMMMLAYEIVRSLGVFRDRGAVIGAVCVGFVHHCFYEIFDQLGPQLRWWAWNTDNAINRPMLASVPMSSVLLFATVGPALVALFTQLLVARRARARASDESNGFGAAHVWRRRADPRRTSHRQCSDPVGRCTPSRRAVAVGRVRPVPCAVHRGGPAGSASSVAHRSAPAGHTEPVRPGIRSDVPGGDRRTVAHGSAGQPQRLQWHHRRRHADRQRGLRRSVLSTRGGNDDVGVDPRPHDRRTRRSLRRR